MIKNTLTSHDTFLAIDLATVKLWCRIENDAEDDILETLIRSATEAVEAYTDRTVTPSTIEFTFDQAKMRVKVPTAPINSVTKVEIEDADGDRTLLDPATDYYLMGSNNGGVLVLKAQHCGKLVVTVTAGYATLPIPNAIKQAIAVHVGSAYAGREGQDIAQATFERLLNPYRIGVL